MRRKINWRWPLRLWFRSGAEFWEWSICIAIAFFLIAIGFGIIHAPG